MLASTWSDGNVTIEDWLNLKAEEFDQFRLTVAANRARGGTKIRIQFLSTWSCHHI